MPGRAHLLGDESVILFAFFNSLRYTVRRMSLSIEEKSVLRLFKDKVQQILGSEFNAMMLFGSKSRGDDSSDSDIDVLVIVSSDDWHICDSVYNIATNLALETDIYISPKVISQGKMDRLRSENSPFILNIEREAVAV